MQITPAILEELVSILQKLKGTEIPQQGSVKLGEVPSLENTLPNVVLLPAPAQHPDQNRSQINDLVNSFEKGSPLLLEFLRSESLYATEVSGDGFNCFIYSLLQHATLEYNKSRFSEDIVRRVKIEAGINSDSFEMMYSDTPVALKILQTINALYQVNLKVYYFSIDDEGHRIFTHQLFDSTNVSVSFRPVVVWQQPLHYVAICSTNLSSLCLSARFNAVIQPLQKASSYNPPTTASTAKVNAVFELTGDLIDRDP